MKSAIAFIFVAFMALAPVLYAQSAINSGVSKGASAATLPLRNLQIEVRQILRDDAARPMGEMSRSQATAARQQVLVLNGRRATIALRNTVPLRLVQTFVENGVMVVVPGTVWMEAGTGFEATPRWDGQDAVELELAAAQGKGSYHAYTASSSTLVVVPLGEWVTVAQGEQDTAGRQADRRGGAYWTGQSTTEVQVRVSLR